MRTLKEIREERQKHIDQASALVDKAKAEIRENTEEEVKAIDTSLAAADTLQVEMEKVKADLARRDRIAAAKESNTNRRGKAKADDAEAVVEAERRLTITGGEARNDDHETFGFPTHGHFAVAVMNASMPGGAVDKRLEALSAVSGMSQTDPTGGGFLVPPTFATAVWDGMNAAPDNLLNRTDQYTVEGESLTFPANAETSRANGSRYGGIRGYWLAEADQMTSSRPKFRQVKLEPQQLGVFAYVTDKLLKNSPVALEQYLTRAAIDEINFLVGDSIINGTGVGKPKGLLLSGAVVSVAKETSQVAATLVQENIVKMWSRLHARSRAGAAWYINQDVEPQLWLLNTKVKNVAGSENVGGFQSMIFNPQNMTLLGRPIVPIEYAATLGTQGDVILADLKAYATGVRGGVDAAMSMHLRFDYNESAFRFLFEIDGQGWLNSAITPFKGTATLSPFVVLDTRS